MANKILFYRQICTTIIIGILCAGIKTLYSKENKKNEKGKKIMKISKVVIPAAGLGTRCLPLSKAFPKELLPLVDKPAIQYIIEEGIDADISEFCIVANEDKKAIRDYFSPNKKLDAFLKEKNLSYLMQSVDKIINTTKFSYVPQPEPRGLGHAILMAREIIGNEYFGVFLPDEIMVSTIPVMAQLIQVAQQYNATVVGVLEVPKEQVSSYGIVGIKQKLDESIYEVAELIEKPTAKQAPSNLAIIGRYILSPTIFDTLAKTKPGTKGEIQLTDAIAQLLKQGERVLAYKIKADRFDIGNIPGWLQANYYFTKNNPAYASYLK
ncbi:MAG: UTP--glucose-1-phosphate uridylyltransferase [Candidatus Babeliales bacterium]